jgi:hypothetical protein
MPQPQKLTDDDLEVAAAKLASGMTVAAVTRWLATQGISVTRQGLTEALKRRRDAARQASAGDAAATLATGVKAHIARLDKILTRVGRAMYRESKRVGLINAREFAALAQSYRSLLDPYLRASGVDEANADRGGPVDLASAVYQLISEEEAELVSAAERVHGPEGQDGGETPQGPVANPT